MRLLNYLVHNLPDGAWLSGSAPQGGSQGLSRRGLPGTAFSATATVSVNAGSSMPEMTPSIVKRQNPLVCTTTITVSPTTTAFSINSLTSTYTGPASSASSASPSPPVSSASPSPGALITDFDPVNSPYQGCFSRTTIPVLNDASFTAQNMTDTTCRTFCGTNAAGAPYTYFGIQNGETCRCGNTDPVLDSPLSKEDDSFCNTPNTGDPTQAGGSPDAINVWLVAPLQINLPSSSLPVSLPTGSPSLSVPVSVPSVTGLPTGNSALSSLLSQISAAITTLPSSISLPVTTGLPSGAPGLSSLLSEISSALPSSASNIPSGVLSSLLSSLSLPAPTNLPTGSPELSSLLSQISSAITSLPSTTIPTSSIPISSLPSALLSSLLSQISAGATTLPTGLVLPTGAELSSLLSTLSIPAATSLPSGVSAPVSVPVNSNLPSSLLSSLLSGISTGVTSLSSGNSLSIPTSVPSLTPPSLSSLLSSSPISVPAISSGAPTTIGTPLPAPTPVDDPTTLNFDDDPQGTFLGCVSSTGLNGQPLFDGPAAYNSSFTQVSCHAFCDAQPGGPFQFYALEQGNLCHCATILVSANVANDPNGCTIAAAGDPTRRQAGGGPRGRAVVFSNDDFVPPNTLTTTFNPNHYEGCFQDAQGGTGGARLFDGPSFNRNDTLTQQGCKAFCTTKSSKAPAAPYKYFGLEFGRDCRCGNSYKHARLTGTCKTACSGNSKQACGGANSMNVWVNSDYPTSGGSTGGGSGTYNYYPTAGSDRTPQPADRPQAWVGDGVDAPYFPKDSKYWEEQGGQPAAQPKPVTGGKPKATPGTQPKPEKGGYPANNKPSPKPEAKPAPKPEPKPAPKPAPKPEPKPEPKPAPKPAASGYHAVKPSGYPTNPTKRWLSRFNLW